MPSAGPSLSVALGSFCGTLTSRGASHSTSRPVSVCWLWVAGFHFILGIVAMWDIYNFVKCWKIKVTLCNIAGLNSLIFFGNASCSLGTGEELKTEAQTA